MDRTNPLRAACLRGDPRWRRVACAPWLCAALIASDAALAAPSTGKVATVFSHGVDLDSRVGASLARELAAEGFVVRSCGAENDSARLSDCVRLAWAAGSRALIHVPAPRAGMSSLEVLLLDANGVARREAIEGEAGDAAEDLIAVRAVEVLRASLLEAPSETGNPAPSPVDDRPKDRPTAPARSGGARRTPHFWGSAEPDFLYAGSDLTLLDAAVSAGWTPSSAVSLSAGAAFPILPASVRENEGEARVRVIAVALGVTWHLIGVEHPVSPFVGVKTGALFLDVESLPLFPYGSSATSLTSFFGSLTAGCSFALRGSLHLRADAAVGAAFPLGIIRFGGREVARFGLPLVEVAAGPEVVW